MWNVQDGIKHGFRNEWFLSHLNSSYQSSPVGINIPIYDHWKFSKMVVIQAMFDCIVTSKFYTDIEWMIVKP